MRKLILWLLFYGALALSRSAIGADEVYRILPLKETIREAMRESGNWQACGYFAAAETTSGRIVYFNYILGPPELVPVLAFLQIGQIEPDVDRALPVPIVIIRGPDISVWMNADDYLESLPCLSNGPHV